MRFKDILIFQKQQNFAQHALYNGYAIGPMKILWIFYTL